MRTVPMHQWPHGSCLCILMVGCCHLPTTLWEACGMRLTPMVHCRALHWPPQDLSRISSKCFLWLVTMTGYAIFIILSHCKTCSYVLNQRSFGRLSFFVVMLCCIWVSGQCYVQAIALSVSRQMFLCSMQTRPLGSCQNQKIWHSEALQSPLFCQSMRSLLK